METSSVISSAQISLTSKNGMVEISAPTKGEYVVYNTAGNEIQHGRLNPQAILNLTAQPDGIYFLKVSDQRGSYFKKLSLTK